MWSVEFQDQRGTQVRVQLSSSSGIWISQRDNGAHEGADGPVLLLDTHSARILATALTQGLELIKDD